MTAQGAPMEKLHQTMKSYQPPSRSQWTLWIGGFIASLILLVGVSFSFIVLTRVDAKTSQTPVQYQQITKQLNSIQTTANLTEKQVKVLCNKVFYCSKR